MDAQNPVEHTDAYYGDTVADGDIDLSFLDEKTEA